MSPQPEPARQLALLDEAQVKPAGWRVRPSPRARRLAVRVLPGGFVEIVVPHGTRPRTIEQFVSRHRGWIDRKVVQYRPADPDTADALPDVIRFAASGHAWDVHYRHSPAAPRLHASAGNITVTGDCQRLPLVRHALQRFTMRMAHQVFAPWLAGLSASSGLGYERLQIRRQRTRWGSCSRHGTISLNACLLFQPADVVNYLLIHELAHTRHMNHSRRFWAAVERLEPGWRALDASLSQGWRRVPAWVLR